MERPVNDKDDGACAAPRGPLGSDRGAALLLVIVLSTIALVIMTTVLYMITVSTQLSGAEKRYRTAHEAAVERPVEVEQVLDSLAEVLILEDWPLQVHGDGEPLKRDELETRQRQLQDELRKKAEEQRKKLQEEQDKAKTGAPAN